MSDKPCKDCVAEGVTTKRPAPHAGPRCATHYRAVKKQRRARDHDRRVQAVYGLEPGDYQALYDAQGGVCAICNRARGLQRKLAVDHDHDTGWVRGLLCIPCNVGVLGHLRDDPAALQRAIDYLSEPPAWAAIGKKKAEHGEGES